MIKWFWIICAVSLVGLWGLSTIEDIYDTWQFFNPKGEWKPLTVFLFLRGSSQLFIVMCVGLAIIKSLSMWGK